MALRSPSAIVGFVAASPTDKVEFIAFFLVFAGVVLLSGLLLAWRYRRVEKRRDGESHN